MFKGQPKGLYALALANTGERFGYYTMLAVFALFLRANFGLEAGVAGAIYSTFLGEVCLEARRGFFDLLHGHQRGGPLRSDGRRRDQGVG